MLRYPGLWFAFDSGCQSASVLIISILICYYSLRKTSFHSVNGCKYIYTRTWVPGYLYKDGISSHVYNRKDRQTTHISMERERKRYLHTQTHTKIDRYTLTYIHTYTYMHIGKWMNNIWYVRIMQSYRRGKMNKFQLNAMTRKNLDDKVQWKK